MSDKLIIKLLGAPQILLNGRSLHFPSAKAIALLAYLAVSGRPHDRSELAALLWPESDNKRARGALRYTLSQIKKEIGDGFLLTSRQQIGLDPTASWEADSVQMEALLAAGQAELTAQTVEPLQTAVSLYQADFLQSFTLRDAPDFNQWAAAQAEQLQRELATALRRLAFFYEAQQQWETAVSYAHRWLNLDPLHEPAHCHLMQLYAALGEWTAVHNQYQALTDLLERELGVGVQPETAVLYQQLRQQRQAAMTTITVSKLTSEQRSRHVLLEKMRRFWVNGLLQPLRAENSYIPLNYQTANDLIEHPWADIIDISELQNTTKISHAFQTADRALLILGAPGAGKTISLIGLAERLLARANADDNQPLPVLLNLSGWAGQQRPLGDWAIEEMVAKYQIPRRLGRRWLADDQLLLLLDGLDELPAVERPAAILAINDYRQGHGLADLVVCCRLEAYETAVREHNARLYLNGAIKIRPLTTGQIRQHVPPALHQTLFADETLLEMAQSPLNLHMMRQALPNEGDGLPKTAVFNHQTLFAHYVRQMLQRQADKGAATYAASELLSQLGWLAQQMQRHNQSIFLLEQIQPSWLRQTDASQNGRWQWGYLFGARALFPAVLGTIIMWSFVQLIGLNPPYIKLHFLAQFSAVFGLMRPPWNELLALFCLNLLAGMLSAAVSGLFFRWRRRRGDDGYIARRLGWLQIVVSSGVAWLSVTLPLLQTDGRSLALFQGGMAAFGLALVFGGLSYGQSFRTEIRVRGALKWSWRQAVLFGVVGGLLSLLWSALIWLRDPSAFAGVTNMLNMGLLFFLLGGLSDRQPVLRNRPNEGIRVAWLNGVKAAVIVTVPAVFLIAATVNLASGLHTGLMLGIFAGTIHGFNDVFKHGIVRLLLWRQYKTPLNYVAVLDAAADAVLLQKVGGGYAFRHRLLQAYFAEDEAAR